MAFSHHPKAVEKLLSSDMFGQEGYQNRRKPNLHFGYFKSEETLRDFARLQHCVQTPCLLYTGCWELLRRKNLTLQVNE